MVQPTPDDTLLKRVAEGDMAALEVLYERHHARVYSLCLRLTGWSVAEAEGLTHKAFVQMFRQAGNYRGKPSFRKWFHRLAVKEVLTHFRQRGVLMQQSEDEGETLEQLAVSTANQGALPMINRSTLERAVASLPVGFRTVFVLHDVEGYEHEEVASLLGIETGAGKLQLHEARMRLRALLRQHHSPKPQAHDRHTGDAHTNEDG